MDDAEREMVSEMLTIADRGENHRKSYEIVCKTSMPIERVDKHADRVRLEPLNLPKTSDWTDRWKGRTRRKTELTLATFRRFIGLGLDGRSEVV